MREANVGTARVRIFWNAIESTPRISAPDWALTDQRVGGFASRGIAVLPVLFATPAWLANDVAIPPVAPIGRSAHGSDSSAEAVERYGQGGTYWTDEYPVQFPGAQPKPITTWQVWNEQNGPKHFLPRPNVKKYATLLGIANRAVAGRGPQRQDPHGRDGEQAHGERRDRRLEVREEADEEEVGPQ